MAYHSARLRRPDAPQKGMIAPKIISAELLLWTEILLLWSFVSYGIAADPLKEEAQRFRWQGWSWLLAFRVVVMAVVAYAMTRLFVLSIFLLFFALLFSIF